MYAEVLVEIKAKAVDKTFTYKIPENFNIEVGKRVLVPFGNRKLEGFVLKIDNKEVEYKIKNIIDTFYVNISAVILEVVEII